MDISIIATAIDHATAPLKNLAASILGLGEAEKKTGENSQAMANGLKAIEIVIGGIIIEKAEELSKKFLELAGNTQNADIRLAAWVGGAEKAGQVLQSLNNSVGASGIKMDSLAQSVIKLRAAGIGTDAAVADVKSLANAIAAVGGDDVSAKLDAAATAFQTFSAKGFVSMKELTTILKDTGVTAGELAAAGGMKYTQFIEALTSKSLTAQVVLDDFNRAAQKKFGDFAFLLGDTLSGALAKFSNDWKLAFAGVSETPGGATDQLVAFVQNLDKAFTQFITNKGPALIMQFINFLKDSAPTLSRIIDLLVTVGKAIFGVADIIARVLAALPAGLTEYGLIGYLIWGGKGALIGALLGLVDAGIRKVDEGIVKLIYDMGLISFDSMQQKLDRLKVSSLDLLASYLPGSKGNQGSDWISKYFGTPAQLDAIAAGVKKIESTPVGGNGMTGIPENTALENRLKSLRDQADNAINEIGQKSVALADKTAGNQLQEQIDSISETTGKWLDQLNTVKDNIDKSKLSKQEIAEYDALILTLEKQITKNASDAKDETRALNALKVQQLNTETQIALVQDRENARQLQQQINQSTNSGAAIYGGTSAYAQQEEYMVKMNQLQLQSLGYDKDIETLQAKIKTDSVNAADYQKQINGITQVKNLTQQYASTLTAAGMAQTKFLNELGSAIEGDLASGISGLIQGTMTWGDVGRKVFGDLIDMSVKYLLKLAEMELFGETAAASSIALAAPLAASLTAIWGPAAMAASIATLGAADATGELAFQTAMATSMLGFANGGVPGLADMSNSIVQGPTMFGVAGEAGSEAILPLTRIGGKLGVRSDGGGGGNHYHITVQAIDTQSGLDFIGKHLGSIDSGLQQRKRVNLK